VTRIGPNNDSNGKPFVYDELLARMRAVLRQTLTKDSRGASPGAAGRPGLRRNAGANQRWFATALAAP